MIFRSIFLPAILCLPAVVFGSPVTLSFNATSQADGAPVSGSFTYDDDPKNADEIGSGGFADYNSYQFVGAPYHSSITLSGQKLATADNVGIDVCNSNSEMCSLGTNAVAFLFKRNAIYYILELAGPSASFNGTSIPDAATLSSFWTDGAFYVRDGMGIFTSLTATVSSVTVSSVPEPASWQYLLAGSLLVAGASVAQRRKLRDFLS